MEIKAVSKQFEKARLTLKALEQNKEGLDVELKLLSDAHDALKSIDINSSLRFLAESLSIGKIQLENLLAQRRQALENSAREANIAYRRLSTTDKVGLFELTYSKSKVIVKVGSEILCTLEEVDGKKLLDRLVLEKNELEKNRLTRENFFKAMKLAIALAYADGKVQNGKVKVHDLFTYLVLTRQLVQSDVFRKKPTQKSFSDYSKAMLIFELFKFGEHEDGWILGSERLSNQGPNMATQSEALMLPDTGGSIVQILWLWVAKQ